MQTHKTISCPHCGTPHTIEVCDMFPRAIPPCDDCAVVQSENYASNQGRETWERMLYDNMPSGYRVATPEKIPRTYVEALAWRAETKYGGLGLIGPSGLGKSFTLACVVYHQKRAFRWLSGTEARDAAIEAAAAERDREGARRKWQNAMRTAILVIDDISQSRFTDAWSSKLYDLLETRMSHRLPTLWTSQISLPDLRAKIARQNGGDTEQAEAISRRLAQHSRILNALIQ